MGSGKLIKESVYFTKRDLNRCTTLTSITGIVPMRALYSVIFCHNLSVRITIRQSDSKGSSFKVVTIGPRETHLGIRLLGRVIRSVARHAKGLLRVIGRGIRG